MFIQIKTGRIPFVCCIILSYIKSIVVFGSWLGSYHKYGLLPATYSILTKNSTEMVRTDRIEVEIDSVLLKNCSSVYYIVNRFFPAGFGSWLGLSSHGGHHS
jgi:hypothetical protein